MERWIFFRVQKLLHDASVEVFAAGHGKGVVDGVGGRAKSLVRTAVKSRGGDRPIVQGAKDFCQLLEPKMTKTIVVYVPEVS